MSSNQISEQELALIVLLRYECARLKSDGISKHEEFAKCLGVDLLTLNGVFQQSNRALRNTKQSKLRRDEFDRKCARYFKKKYDQLAELPAYIRDARYIAFPHLRPKPPQNPILHERAVEAVADVFVRYNLRDYQSKTRSLQDHLGGKIFDVYRWAGPSDRTDRRTREEPRAIRASAKFFHPEATGSFVRFHLHYRPYPIGSETWKMNSSPYRAEGIVVPIDQHILLIGAESRSSYPLIVIADFSEEAPNQFGGLVLRKADSKPQIFTSRVVFRLNLETSGEENFEQTESGRGPTLSTLDNRIGIIWEADLTKEEKSVLQDFVNYDERFDGKIALTLQRPI